MQAPVHPVDPPLDEAHVGRDQEQIWQNPAYVPVYPGVGGGHAELGEDLDDRREERVEGHGFGGHLDLLEDRGARGHGEASRSFVGPGEEGVAEDVVDVVDPDPCCCCPNFL